MGLFRCYEAFNDAARYVDQGGGNEKILLRFTLSLGMLILFDFLDLRKNHGKEERRARDLFFALWTNDLFMQRVRMMQSGR